MSNENSYFAMWFWSNFDRIMALLLLLLILVGIIRILMLG